MYPEVNQQYTIMGKWMNQRYPHGHRTWCFLRPVLRATAVWQKWLVQRWPCNARTLISFPLSTQPPPHPLPLYAFSNWLQFISVLAGNWEGGWALRAGFTVKQCVRSSAYRSLCVCRCESHSKRSDSCLHTFCSNTPCSLFPLTCVRSSVTLHW